MGFFNNSERKEKQKRINELSMRLEQLKRDCNNPNLTDEELDYYQNELSKINTEIDKLLNG